jgi:hypothetical protein
VRTFPYEGILLPSDVHDKFHRRFHCPTACDATTLDYEEVAGDATTKVSVVLLGNPLKVGPNINSCDETLLRTPCNIEATWTLRSTDAILAAVTAARLKGGPVREISVASNYLSVTVPYRRTTKVHRTEIVIKYGKSFHTDAAADADEHCDVCHMKHNLPQDPILLCDEASSPGGCSEGRHRLCFTHSIPLDAISAMAHLCQRHEALARPPRKAHPRSAHKRSATGATVPLDCTPELRNMVAGFNRHQALLAGQQWQEGLSYNAGQLGTVVKASDIPNSGLGLFLREDRAPSAPGADEVPIGWLWGSIVTTDRFRQLISDAACAESGTPEERAFVNDWRVGIRRVITLEEVFATSESTYVLLVSRQCPIGYMNDRRNSATAKGAQCTLRWPSEWLETPTHTMHHMTLPVFAANTAHSANTELFLDYGWPPEDWRHVNALKGGVTRKHARAHASRVEHTGIDAERGSTPAAMRRQKKAKGNHCPKPGLVHQSPVGSRSPVAPVFESPVRQVRRSGTFTTVESLRASGGHACKRDGHASHVPDTEDEYKAKLALQRQKASPPASQRPTGKRHADDAFGGATHQETGAGPASAPSNDAHRSKRAALMRQATSAHGGDAEPTARRSLHLELSGGASSLPVRARAHAGSLAYGRDVDMIDLTVEECAPAAYGSLLQGGSSDESGCEDGGTADDEGSRPAVRLDPPVHDLQGSGIIDEADPSEDLDSDDDQQERIESEEEYCPHPSDAAPPPSASVISSPCATGAGVVPVPRKALHPLCNFLTLKEMMGRDTFASQSSSVEARRNYMQALKRVRSMPKFKSKSKEFEEPIWENVDRQFSVIQSCCGQSTLLSAMRAMPGYNVIQANHPFDSVESMMRNRLSSCAGRASLTVLQPLLLSCSPNPLVSGNDAFSQARVYRVDGMPTCINCLQCCYGRAKRTFERVKEKMQSGAIDPLMASSVKKSGRPAGLVNTVVSFLLLFLSASGLCEFNPVSEGRKGIQVMNLPFANRKELLQYMSNEKFRHENQRFVMSSESANIEPMCKDGLFRKALQIVEREHHMSIVVTKSKKFMRCDTCLQNDYASRACDKDPNKREKLRVDKDVHLEQTKLERKAFEGMRDRAL